MKTDAAVSNYPRASDVPELSREQARVTLALVNSLDGWVLGSLFGFIGVAVTFGYFALNFGIGAGLILFFVSVLIWTHCFRKVKDVVLEYAAVAGWSTGRTLFACIMVYSCLTLLPGLIGLTNINQWMCNDLKPYKIVSPGGNIPKHKLQAIEAKPDLYVKETFDA
ncbi:MAG TPA: hypothetical protein VK171_11925 [Fimbriimonas sp.]|nr:hypothetical protein [Fimbriimonas sp.]